ncbi:hypothetical protein ABZV92_19200 [Streptomyces rubiginosohelvolus]|uniref:hypothetical protein n=1 Tax=Streptomyces rubiginosohelvolus TaxID=67362 RepID=UPI00339F3E0C
MQDETGAHDDLREQVAEIVARVAPLVESASGLDLPDRVNFRIVPVETAQSAMTGHMADLFRTYRGLVPRWRRPFVTVFAALLVALFSRRSAVRCEFLVSAATYTLPGNARSETLLVPEALRHTGVLTDVKHLTSLIVHELTHQMQNGKSANRANWTANKVMTALHAGGINYLEEGHACWTDQAVTRALYGTAVDVRSAPTSEEYKNRARGHRRGVDVHRVGLLLVESVIEMAGLPRLNEVWQNHRLLPTRDEEAEGFAALACDQPTRPTRWACRLARASSDDVDGRISSDG